MLNWASISRPSSWNLFCLYITNTLYQVQSKIPCLGLAIMSVCHTMLPSPILQHSQYDFSAWILKLGVGVGVWRWARGCLWSYSDLRPALIWSKGVLIFRRAWGRLVHATPSVRASAHSCWGQCAPFLVPHRPGRGNACTFWLLEESLWVTHCRPLLSIVIPTFPTVVLYGKKECCFDLCFNNFSSSRWWPVKAEIMEKGAPWYQMKSDSSLLYNWSDTHACQST